MFGKNTGQYGRYNGFTEEGLDAAGGFSSVTRAAWDSSGTSYYEFGGSNLNYQFGDHLGTAVCPTVEPATYPVVNERNQQLQRPQLLSKTANDLGPNAALNFSIGDQGHWGLTGYYDAISYTGNIIDSIYTVSGNHRAISTAAFMPWGGATSPTGAAGVHRTTLHGPDAPRHRCGAAVPDRHAA